jgi:dihydroorotase
MASRIIRLKKGCDGHCHFRDNEMMQAVAHFTAEQFSNAVAMGNTIPPIETANQAVAYGQRIVSALPAGSNFSPVLTIMLTRNTTPEIVDEAGKRGVKVLKLIPKGVSTNSEQGIGLNELPDFYPVLEAVQKSGMVFSGHWESLLDAKGTELPNIARESCAIKFLDKVVKTFPKLKIAVEHASTKNMVDYVRQQSLSVRATLTLHHRFLLYYNVCNEDGSVRNPFYYCKPVAKHLEDRIAVYKAMVSGDPHFYFGSDSAPHLISAKMKIPPAAGIFSAPIAKPALAETFDNNNALNRLDDFDAGFFYDFYGLDRPAETVDMTRKDWVVPDEYGGVRPFMAGETLHWQIAE